MSERDLIEVINRMVEVIPTDQEGLRSALERLRRNVLFTAPEAMSRRWDFGEQVLAFHMPPIEDWEPWCHEVADIWTGRKPL